MGVAPLAVPVLGSLRGGSADAIAPAVVLDDYGSDSCVATCQHRGAPFHLSIRLNCWRHGSVAVVKALLARIGKARPN